MSGFFGVLQDSDSDKSDSDNSATMGLPLAPAKVDIPSYEDLSTSRTDEETVLEAVYGEDFRRFDGVWGCARLEVNIRPPDVDPERIGCQLCLSVQVGKQYPYVPPAIKFQHVKGLSKAEQSELMNQLSHRAIELSQTGSVMMIELVQVVEDFLVDHNRDPTMSAWEEMKAREAQEKAKERQAQEELNQLMDTGAGRGIVAPSPSSRTRPSISEADQPDNGPASTDIERELVRQREALNTAMRVRRGQATPLMTNDEELGELVDDEDDDDFDPEVDANFVSGSTSRYKSDFIELGVLGRGGGGEVVKVRNRLDRRIYAVKKIVLESERGRFANSAAVQNRKLRREVTTISRMTHNSIVRYYQAWVEGSIEPIDENEESQGNPSKDDEDQGEKLDSIDANNDESSDGWWVNSHLIAHMESNSSLDEKKHDLVENSTSQDGSEESSNSEGFESDSQMASGLGSNKLHSESMVDLLEQENYYEFQSPLLTGLGFQNQMYGGLIDEKDMKQSPQVSDSVESDTFDDSSVKVGNGDGKTILYIQMEYCATTLRKLIDDRDMEKMEENEKWRLIRQILEALVYIHGRNIIHRDLKPGNVFIDGEGNIRLGDFGLATTHRSKSNDEEEDLRPEAEKVYDAIEDISRLIGDPVISSSRASGFTSCDESMTGGVGTTFYRAPEQEGTSTYSKGDGSYNVQADIFSLGITLFEMFHPPFPTYMERADILTTLRGDTGSNNKNISSNAKDVQDDLKSRALARFPLTFVESVPENAQRIILWCLEKDPTRRPNAEELLMSELLPRKIELEQRYLEEALEILTSSQSESYLQILKALFNRPTPDVVNLTFDTDVAAKANALSHDNGAKGLASPSEDLLRAISDIRAGTVHATSLRSFAMSASSLAAATSTLRRARHAGKIGKSEKGMLKRATKRTAGIFAMRAATTAAVTGALDGVHGADPMVVEAVCEKLKLIFEMHGAARLRSPLLRPRPNTSNTGALGGPAELMNLRGSVILLPEDLTASFARAIGRGGSATSHLKRYDIDKVFHKSMAGGHPRELLEASFDIIYEDTSRGDMVEAETILVASEALSLLPSRRLSLFKTTEATSPLWYIRLNHTRLADAVLDLCGIPQKEALRRLCFHILTRFTSLSPGALMRSLKTNSKRAEEDENVKHMQDAGRLLEEAVQNYDMPSDAAERFRGFIASCYPPSSCIASSIESMKQGLAALRSMLLDGAEPRKIKRFEDAAKSLRSVKALIEVLESLSLTPLIGSNGREVENGSRSRPLYIALDLGLRQRRKHYHGGNIFQCIVLPNNFFDTSVDIEESHDFLISQSGRGIKVAEGGNYSELVRKNRPPGNFATALVDYYTTSPIPACAGVRFAIGKFVELIYLDATLSGQSSTSIDNWNPNEVENPEIDAMRYSLGFPLSHSRSVQCLVASVHGMDVASVPERFQVAARLWAEGISAEYLSQSSVMLSISKRIEHDGRGDSDWSLVELYGVCSLLKIPFIVIVQPHLLKDKGSVRLRQVQFDPNSWNHDSSTTTNNIGEIFVSLENLATTILGAMSTSNGANEEQQPASTGPLVNNAREQRHAAADVECIYVDNDQYFGNDREAQKSETPKWKSYQKVMKTIEFNATSYLSSLHDASILAAVGIPCTPVFAVTDASFWVLRDFGTALMRREQKEQSASGACQEMIEKYPKHKRSLKTLGIAIDNYMRRYGLWGSRRGNTGELSSLSSLTLQRDSHAGGSTLITVLLYSRVDDRFDMISLHQAKDGKNGGASQSNNSNNNHSSGISSRRRY